MDVLLDHAPHLVPAILLFCAILWLWVADLRAVPADVDADRLADWEQDRRAHARERDVPRPIATTALAALGAASVVLATSLALYLVLLLELEQAPLLVALHCAASIALCGIVWVKLQRLGAARWRRNVRLDQLGGVLASAAATALLVPLLVTGALALLPATDSRFVVNLHLMVAAWWTFAVAWHLALRLRRTLRGLRSRAPARPTVHGGVRR